MKKLICIIASVLVFAIGFMSAFSFTDSVCNMVETRQIADYLEQIKNTNVYLYDVVVDFYTYEKCEKGRNTGFALYDNIDYDYLITTYDYGNEIKVEWVCGNNGVYPIAKIEL